MSRRSHGGGIGVYWVNQFAVPPDQPGGTRHYDMASELGRLGARCTVVASDLILTTRRYCRRRRWWSFRPIHEVLGDASFTWLSAGAYRANDWRRGFSMLVFAAGAFMHLLRVPVDGETVFIGSSPQLFAAATTCLAARIRRVPFVLEVRDLWPESYTGVVGKTAGPEIRVLRLLADHLYRRSAAIVLLAEPNRTNVVEHGASPERVHVVPNGVDLVLTEEASAPEVDLHRRDRFTFVYAGAHGPANGLDIVIDACERLEGRSDQVVRVVLIGDGPSKPELQVQVLHAGLRNIEFMDPLPKAAVHDALRTADAGLMVLAPVEVFATGVSPNKLFDYLACDLPVLTNVPGIVGGIVEAASAGLVVAGGDPEALADGMQRLSTLSGPELDRMRKGRQYVAQHYDRRVLAAELHSILGGVVSAAR